MASHGSLLLQPTVVLKGQDDRVWGQLGGRKGSCLEPLTLPQSLPFLYTCPPTPSGQEGKGRALENPFGETKSLGSGTHWASMC